MSAWHAFRYAALYVREMVQWAKMNPDNEVEVVIRCRTHEKAGYLAAELAHTCDPHDTGAFHVPNDRSQLKWAGVHFRIEGPSR